MKKLLVIVGPTATGKTNLALHLAKILDGELLSADSRQVYKELNIGTGKDIPPNSKFLVENTDLGKRGIGFYLIDGVKIWGYDLVSPKEEFSVSHYLVFADSILKDIWNRGKLPILVGGTGLYVKAVVDGIETATIPKDESLREFLLKKSADELFELLAQIDSVKAASLNVSDRKNPHRLIRSIEVAKWKLDAKNRDLESKEAVTETDEAPLANASGVFSSRFGAKPSEAENSSHSPTSSRSWFSAKEDKLFIGLTALQSDLYRRVTERVNERVKKGIEKEIAALIGNGVGWDMQSMNTLGYKEWKAYFKGEKNKEMVIEQWKYDEKKYIKRQLTWFKKDLRINWFDISKNTWKKAVDNTAWKWYKLDSSYAEKD